MLQVVKVFSLAIVFTMSLIPFKGHLAAKAHSAPAPSAPASSSPVGPSVHPMQLDDRSSASWTVIDKSEQAVLVAAQAQAQAQAQAAKANAAPVAAAPTRAATIPIPAPAPARAVAAPTSAASVQDLIRQAFAPQGQAAVDWGLRVAACESGYNPNAHNASGASGVFQFMPATWKGTPYGNQNIFDAAANVNAAAWYYQKNGGGAWSCK